MSETPTTIGRYEIRRELGRGTMGVVYEAYDPVLGRRVALKTIQLAFAASDAERDAFEKRFFTEARVAAGLQHPNIVVIHDFGRDPASGVLFMALEHLAGQPLSEQQLPMEPREALRITGRVADALQLAHAQGIVHRDIKPANIMRLPSGEPKIMDFGIAKAPASDLTAAGQVFGTPVNMSPEQAHGRPLDGRSDIFSLGTVLYHLLTGTRAFYADSLGEILDRVTHAEPTPPSRIAPGLPAGADAIVARALAKDPANRYADGRAFAEDIEDVLAGRAPRHAGRAGERTLGPARDTASGPELAPVEDTTPLEELLADAPAAPATPAAPPVGRAAPGRSRARGPRRRGIALGALLGLIALSAGLWWLWPVARVPQATPGPPGPGESTSESNGVESGSADPAGAGGLLSRLFEKPARLSIDFEHHLKSGRIRAWVDDELVLEEELDARVTRKLLSFRLRKGSLQEELEVAPGRRQLRVQVLWDDNDKLETISGTFRSGARRTLEVRVGRLRKNLSLEWR